MLLYEKNIILEFIGPVNFYIGLGAKVLSAILLGLIIGLDREKKFKSAGIKTQIMICVGATIYTSISFLNIDMYRVGTNIDPNRLTAQIVSGIGFLGAGAIIQSRGTVVGLTTAATIWVVAAIGVAVGSGYIFSALFFTITILAILNLIEPILKLIGREEMFHLEVKGHKKMIKSIKRQIEDMSLDLIDSEIFHSAGEDDRSNFHLEIKSGTKDMKKFLNYLKSHSRVDTVSHKSVRKSPV